MSSLNTPEPAPIPDAGQPVWPLVIAMIADDTRDEGTPSEWSQIAKLVAVDGAERDQQGIAKYGTPLCVGDGRNPLVDAYQEALDLMAYLKKAQLEATCEAGELLGLGADNALDLAVFLRGMLLKGGAL